MRLISMSSHAHLKNKQGSFESYTRNLKQILSKIKKIISQTDINALGSIAKTEKVLICVLSSQKGLCGTFNSSLVHFFNKYATSLNQSDISLFLVGKKIIDSLSPDYSHLIIGAESNFSLRTVPDILMKLQSVIQSFDRVIVIHNVLKTFFVQKPLASIIMPLEWGVAERLSHDLSEYQWEVNPKPLFENLMKEYIHTTLEYLLLQSLLAEHAARFIAMDNSTRNAHTLLEEKKIEYNKLRQAKITKELTELSGIFTL